MQPAEYGDDGELLQKKFCIYCGSENSPDASSCTNCSARFSVSTQWQRGVQPSFGGYPIAWFPYQKISIYIPESVEDVSTRLSKATFRRRWEWKPRNVGSFMGDVSVKGFNINRIIGYRNDFMPILHGTFTSVDGGTQITVRLIMRPLIFVFMALWYSLPLAVALSMLLGGSGLFVFPFGFVLFPYIIMTVAFNFEAHKAKVFLHDVFRPRKKQA